MHWRLPARFWWFATAASLCTAGLVTFGLIGFHVAHDRIVPTAGVPLLYAAAMATGGLAALATGVVYDRVGPRILLALPVLVAGVPPLAFAATLPAVVAGILLWGAAVGVQDSTVKALVADLVPRGRRASAYGVFAALQGTGALAGGAAAGALYQHSADTLTCRFSPPAAANREVAFRAAFVQVIVCSVEVNNLTSAKPDSFVHTLRLRAFR